MLLKLRGLGPKRVRALWRELEIEGPSDLQRAAEEGRVQSLRGFGAKTVERILAGLERLQGNSNAPRKSLVTSAVNVPKSSRSSGRLSVGTSGYSYAQWKGSFYPDDAKADEFLALYAEQLATVEINNTFYRFPSEKVIQQWVAQTPAHFRFAIKAHRRITHQSRLGESARDTIIEFVERCGQLGPRLGCILFQLPLNFARDDSRLSMLMESLPKGPRYAIEFRHDSWLADEIQSRLAEHNIACVSGDAENEAASRFVTADFAYVRLRRPNYSTSELNAWDQWFQDQCSQQRDVLAYLKHDESGETPSTVVQRWGHPDSSKAKEALRKTLAEPATSKPSRRRKRG
jgi:uncharacterized protein YecE (DUF72 family)